MKNKIIAVLIIGILIRLILASITLHPDIIMFHLSGRLVGSGNLLNIYDYIGRLPASDPLTRIFPPNLYIYPPAVFVFFGYVSNTLSSIIPAAIHNSLTYNLHEVLGNWQLNILLMLFKAAYLPFDIGIAFLLTKFFTDRRSKFLAFVLWMFNPVAIYATYMMAQFDIIPTFFAVLALYLVSFNKNLSDLKKLYLGAFLLGIGASFKIFPLLFVIPLALIGKSLKTRIITIAIGFVTYFITLVPFLSSPGFRSSALVAGQTLKSFYAQIPISGGESILLYPTFLIFFYIILYFRNGELNALWHRFFIVLAIFFIFTHYHPQWFLWITPFLILDIIKSNLKHWLPAAFALLSFTSLLFFFEPSLTIGMFSPISPNLYDTVSIWKILGLNPNINFSRSIFQTLFVGVAVYYIYYYFPKKSRY